jgi:hypothetical protein
MIASIICAEFDNNIGINQSEKIRPIAMKIVFKTCIDYNIEEGYRYLDMLIYGHNNYVAVLAQERWDVIPNNEINKYRIVKEGSKGYREGKTGWKFVAYHDSCWRSGIEKVIHDNKERIISVNVDKGWNQKVEVKEDLFDEIYKLVSAEKREYYKADNGVLHFRFDSSEYIS